MSKDFLGNVLIPVILPAERQAYLLHLEISKDSFIVESYVATQYEAMQDNNSQEDDEDVEDFIDLDLELPESQHVIENLPGLVLELLGRMGYTEDEISNKL